MTKYFQQKCTIENCNDGFFYPSDKVNIAGIVGIKAGWRNSLKKEERQNSVIPEVGKKGYISINGPLKIDFANDFWVYYEDSISYLDGLDSNKGINSIRFYKCKHLESVSENQHYVEIKEVLDLKDSPSIQESAMPEHWNKFIKSSMKQGDLLEFDFFNLITINVQGDVGMTFLIKKEGDSQFVVMVYDWDFHKSIYYRTKIKVENIFNIKTI